MNGHHSEPGRAGGFFTHNQRSVAPHDSVLVGVQNPEESELFSAGRVQLATGLAGDPLRSIGHHCNRNHIVQLVLVYHPNAKTV
jgi:hypothetical protein